MLPVLLPVRADFGAGSSERAAGGGCEWSGPELGAAD
jgi:hypothetical protein